MTDFRNLIPRVERTSLYKVELLGEYIYIGYTNQKLDYVYLHIENLSSWSNTSMPTFQLDYAPGNDSLIYAYASEDILYSLLTKLSSSLAMSYLYAVRLGLISVTADSIWEIT